MLYHSTRAITSLFMCKVGPEVKLTLIMLNIDVSSFENSVDPDKLASEKPADQDPHFSTLGENTCLA